MSVYVENGHADRQDYLRCLSSDHGVPLDHVQAVAEILGPDEDFDGLVVTLKDAQ